MNIDNDSISKQSMVKGNDQIENCRKVFLMIDKKRGYRPPKRSAEASAIMRMLKGGFKPEQIMKTWEKLKAEPFWSEKELYMMSVESQIGAITHGTHQGNNAKQIKHQSDVKVLH
jgi:hypothetical protein